MKPLFLAALMTIASSATADDSPYRWVITSPCGAVKTTYGETRTFHPVEVGEWRADLEVFYAHMWPPGMFWVATETIFFTVLPREIFVDDFETGTTNKWSSTIGGSNG